MTTLDTGIARIRSAAGFVADNWRRMSRWLNAVMPKGLFARALLIIIIPMVILQSVVAFVFMERHWNTVTHRLSAAVTQDIAALIDVYRSYPQDAERARVALEERRQGPRHPLVEAQLRAAPPRVRREGARQVALLADRVGECGRVEEREVRALTELRAHRVRGVPDVDGAPEVEARQADVAVRRDEQLVELVDLLDTDGRCARDVPAVLVVTQVQLGSDPGLRPAGVLLSRCEGRRLPLACHRDAVIRHDHPVSAPPIPPCMSLAAESTTL